MTPEIAKVIVGIVFVLETILSILVYKLNLIKNATPYSYLVAILSMIGVFVYACLDDNLFTATNHESTYFILLGIIFAIQLIGCLIIYLISRKNKTQKGDN